MQCSMQSQLPTMPVVDCTHRFYQSTCIYTTCGRLCPSIPVVDCAHRYLRSIVPIDTCGRLCPSIPAVDCAHRYLICTVDILKRLSKSTTDSLFQLLESMCNFVHCGFPYSATDGTSATILPRSSTTKLGKQGPYSTTEAATEL